MNFCSQCGAHVTLRVPEGDTRERHVCLECGRIHYLNPRVVVGCVAEWQGKILLCRRAIEPRHGYWTLPAGFMEIGETTEEGAKRETREEANARVSLHAPFALFNVPHVAQVLVFYRATVMDGEYAAGHETLDARLFAENEIPWRELAFGTVHRALSHYFEDRRKGEFGFHTGTITRESQGGA